MARLAELVVVPLDLRGAPTGPASTLLPEVLAPAPVLPGAANRDVSAYVLLTGEGLLRLRRGGSLVVTLVRPAGFAYEGSAIDAAISPSGNRLAWIQAGHLRWVDVP